MTEIRPQRRPAFALLWVLLVAAGLGIAGCGPSDQCASDDDCRSGERCSNGNCVATDWRIDDDVGPGDGESDSTPVGPPRIDVPSSLTMKVAKVGASSTKSFRVRNAGGETLVISDTTATTSGGFEYRFVDAERGGEVRLAPGESFTVEVTFNPQRKRANYGLQFLFRSNDPNRSTATVQITGRIDQGDRGPCVDWKPEKSVDFGTVPVGGASAERVTLENCSRDDDLVLEQPATAPETPFAVKNPFATKRLSPGEVVEVTVTFAPERAEPEKSFFKVATDVPDESTVQIALEGKGARTGDCPIAAAVASVKGNSTSGSKFKTKPLETLVLDGSGSHARKGSIAEYNWSIVNQPKGSTARLTPSSNAKKPNVLLDLVGIYEIQLEVVDSKGTASCQKSTVTAKAVAPGEIYVEMFWNTPKDQNPNDTNGTDLDLHYLHPEGDAWNRAPWDIYWDNKHSDWGTKGVKSDNPRMVAEDDDGAGPEAIVHSKPKSGKSYKVGVYYYDEHGLGTSYASVRVYVNNSRVVQFLDKKMEQFWFWKVGLVEWPSGNFFQRDSINKTGFPPSP